jgi:hypothetical protein
MDFGIIDVVNPLDPSLGGPPFELYEPARHAMGYTRRYAERTKLIDMVPHGDLTSTLYAPADPGAEYLVLQPGETADPFTVDLAAGTYSVEWHSVTDCATAAADTVVVESPGPIGFSPPFASAGPAVLYLRQVGKHHARDPQADARR